MRRLPRPLTHLSLTAIVWWWWGVSRSVMFMVVLSTFEWSSFKMMTTMPRNDAYVLVLVTGLTVLTNLAIAVAVGVVASCLNFAWKSAQRVT
jgi:SulP family sulfate permease